MPAVRSGSPSFPPRRRRGLALAVTAVLLAAVVPGAAQPTGPGGPPVAPGSSFGLDDAPARYEILRVAVDPGMPPLQFVDSGGRPTGFFVDVCLAIGEAEGMAVALYPMDRRRAEAALSAGVVDAILGATYSAGAQEGAAGLPISEPLLASAVAVVSKAGEPRYADGMARLADGVLALRRGSPAYDFLKAIRAVRFNETTNPSDALDLLVMGRADAFLEDRAVASYLLRGRPDAAGFEISSSYWLPVEYGIAVRPGQEYLLYRLNQGLGAIKESGAYSVARERWFGDSERAAMLRLRNALAAFAVALGVIVIGGGGTVWWNRQLASRVRSSTAELRSANEQLERLVGDAEDKKEFIAQILESSPRGLVTCGSDGLVSVCNARAREIGLLSPDPVGRHFSEYPFLSRFLAGGRMERVLSGEAFPFETVEWHRPDGTRLYVRSGLYPQVDHARAVVGVIFSFEDHTTEKAMLERLAERAKDEALGRIVAGIAHEIRNPLTSIKAFVELLPRKMNDPRFLREMGAYVPREVERVDKLIRDLIDFARPRKPKRSVVDIGSLVGSSIALLAPSLAKRGVAMESGSRPGMLASVDADQVRQCVLNLVLNAADAVEDARSQREGDPGSGSDDPGSGGPDIVVSTSASEAAIRVEVRDRGRGMDEATLARVLEPFYTTKRGGVGLGLPLSKQYVEENGGRLELSSAVGVGTTVAMVFPLEGR